MVADKNLQAAGAKRERAVSVGDVIAVMDTAYPPQLAESWDAVGLICGDPAEPVGKIALALDCT